MRYAKTMSEALAEIREGFSKKEIKMAIGVASDPRYKQGNYTGAVNAIEKIKKGLSKHPQVAAVLKRQNENFSEQPEHEITVGDYTTKHFHMCGSAQTVMKKHADKEGAKELTMLQDLFYKMEMEAMEAGSVTDEQKKKSQILYDKIIAKAEEVGIKDEVDKYMKLHLDSMIKGDPKLGFGRTDKQEALDKEDEPKVKEIIKKLKGASKAHAGQADDLEKAVKEEVELDEKVEYVEYKFKNERDAKAAKAYFDGIQLMSFDVNDDNIRGGELMVDAGSKDMTKYHKEVMKKFKPKVMTQESLDEMKEPFVVVDTADGDKVVGMASSEKGAKEIITTAQLPPMKIKDKKTLKIVKVKKKQMIGYPIKEETELDEGYEKEVLLVLKDAGISGSFRSGKLYVDKQDVKDAKSALKDSDNIKSLPRIVGEEVELDEDMKVFRVSSDELNGNVHAKDEKEAEKIFRKKGVKGKITITDRGPKKHYRRVKNDYDLIKEVTELDEDKSSTVYDFDRLIKDGGIDKRDFRKAKNLYVSGKLMDLRKHIYNLDTSPLEAIMDVIAKNDPKAFMKMYPKSKKGEYMSSIAYAHKEEVELDEAKEVLSRFRDDKLKKSIMNLATQKGLKVKEMGDKLEVSGNAKKVMDLTLAVQKHDVKIEQNIMSAYTAAITKQLGVR